jgi:hypothetical protein
MTEVKFVDPSKPDVNEGCVEILREALKRAKDGEVQGVAIALAVYDPESDSGRGTIHFVRYSAAFKDTLYNGVGAMQFSMRHDMFEHMLTVDPLKLTEDDE